MAFGISAYEQNIQNVNAADSSIDGVKGVSAVKAANAAALGSAKEGQVVTGEVIAAHGKTVQLKLPDAQVVTARLEADIKISVGQSMAFAVKANTGNQIALSPLFNSAAVNPAAIKALGQASILVNSDTLAMSTAMMNEGMPVDKQSMQNMYRLVAKYPEAAAEDIVAMTKQGIDINENSLSQFSVYRNNEHQIINLIDDFSNELTDAADKMSFADKIAVSELFNGNEGEIKLQLEQGLSDKVADYENRLMEETVKVAESEVRPKPMGILDVMAERMAQIQEAEQAELLPANDEQQAVAESNQFTAADADTELARVLTNDERSELARDMAFMGMPEETVNSVLNGNMSPQDALAFMQSSMKLLNNGTISSLKLDAGQKEEIEKVIRSMSESPAFKSLLKASVMHELTLQPDGDLSQEKIQQLYHKIVNTADKMSEMFKSNEQLSDFRENLANIKQNVGFMNQLNEAFTYVQLPIQMNGGNGHGDLYVYTNKKKLSEKEGEITAFLRLEMDALGTVDIGITLNADSNVKMDWVLSDDDTITLVNDNIDMLSRRLEERGYHMEAKVKLKDNDAPGAKDNPAISAMLGSKSNQGKGLLSKYSFDVKA